VRAAPEQPDAGLPHAVPRCVAPVQPSDATEAAMQAAPSQCEEEWLRAAVLPDAARADCDSVQAEADAQQVRCGSGQADLRDSLEREEFREELQLAHSESHAELQRGYAAFHAEPAQERCCALPAGSPDEEQRRCSHALADAVRCSDELPWSRSDARFRSGAEYWLRAHLDAERCSGAAAWLAS
jgi:hypothetical protein